MYDVVPQHSSTMTRGSITTASPKSITWVRGRTRAGLGLWLTYHRQPKVNHLKRYPRVVVLDHLTYQPTLLYVPLTHLERRPRVVVLVQ